MHWKADFHAFASLATQVHCDDNQTCIFLAQGSRLWTIFIIVAKTSMARSRSRSRSRSVRPTESDPADEEEQEAFEFDPLVAVEDLGSEEEKALWNNWFSALAQDLWISRFGTLSRMVHFLLTFYYETIDFQLWLRISGFLDFGTLSRMVHFLLTLYYETIHFQVWLKISRFLDFETLPRILISY